MAGGTWDAQNKELPGVYINFKSSPGMLSVIGSRGIVGIPKPLSWGDTEEIIDITSIEDVYPKLGYDINSPQMLFVREMLLGTPQTSGASQILIYRLPAIGAAAAALTISEFTVTARYSGERGNDISVVIDPHPDTEYGDGLYAVFTVRTIVDGIVEDSQTVGSYESDTEQTPATVGDLRDNIWVKFSGAATGLLEPSAGASLSGGLDGSPATTGYSSFLKAIESRMFNVIIYDGDDPVVKSSFALFVKRRSYETGRYCQAVVADYTGADNETCISVTNGFRLNDGTVLDNAKATWWVGGATAGASYNQSLTYKAHPGAVSPYPRLGEPEMIAAVNGGGFVFFEEFGAVKVLTDINTFTGFTPKKRKHFRKNRVIRTLFAIANDVYRTYSRFYIGNTDNDADGQMLLKKDVVGYILELQGNSAVNNFTKDDVDVLTGIDGDAVIVNIAVQPTDAIEKIYMTVTVS